MILVVDHASKKLNPVDISTLLCQESPTSKRSVGGGGMTCGCFQ
jgi:hypothetical protein